MRSLERESAALRSALGARGVELRDVVTFGRTWDGFAATVDTSDLAALSSLGVRAQPVRRFYPATSEPVPVPGEAPKPRAAPPSDQAPIAVLDTGAERAEGGYDAVDRDDDPAPGSDPRAPRRRETTGTALAGIVTAAGERVLSVRVAGYGGAAAPEIHGTTDTLLLGLERAVDPDGDGADRRRRARRAGRRQRALRRLRRLARGAGGARRGEARHARRRARGQRGPGAAAATASSARRARRGRRWRRAPRRPAPAPRGST